jgi:hypothetical protein
MVDKNDFSLILGKGNTKGRSVNVDLAIQQLAEVDALGTNAGRKIAEQLGKAICQQAVEGAESIVNAFERALNSLASCIEYTKGDPEDADMTSGFLIESHGPDPRVILPGVGHIPGATAIENDEELHDKFTESLFEAMTETIKPMLAAAWTAKMERPANVVPLFRKK